MQLGRSGRSRFLGDRDGRQRLPVDLHLLGSVDRRLMAVGDDDGHWITDVPRGVRREWHVRHDRQILDDARDLLLLAEIPSAR